MDHLRTTVHKTPTGWRVACICGWLKDGESQDEVEKQHEEHWKVKPTDGDGNCLENSRA